MARAADPTQMIIFPIAEEVQIDTPSTPAGEVWLKVLNVFENWAGFRRMYWGRHVEEPGRVHLHIVRDSLHQHYALLASPEWQQLTSSLTALGVSSATLLTVRHAMMSEFTPQPQALGNGAPVTGTAIYLTPDPAGWEATWALWTTIVPKVPGCLGVTGGWMVEPMEEQLCYVVYVGWESVEVHDAYHETNHFRQRVVILREHNRGYREYGHVAFKYSRTRRPANL